MVKLYLVRHGKAEKQNESGDMVRALDAAGRDEVGRMASFLARSIRVPRVVHSGYLRAAQTALILSEALGPGKMVEESTVPMGPGDDVIEFAKALDRVKETVMVVGHMPFMADLVSYLTVGDADAGICHFETGAVACLERVGKRWVLRWLAGPAMLGLKGIDKGD
ncbi:MAG: phosphohistidine phosphatase SixA [Rhodospirillales bacterium]